MFVWKETESARRSASARTRGSDRLGTLVTGRSRLFPAVQRRRYGRNSSSDILLEIRPGVGGSAADLWAADRFQMYRAYSQRRGWSFEVTDDKAHIAKLGGSGVCSRLQYEPGIHRVQRVPETERKGRLHTSTATVAVLQLPQTSLPPPEVNAKDLVVETFRASGHGGQHVNKTESAVRIRHIPSGIVISNQDERDQHANKAKALKLLAERLHIRQRIGAAQALSDTRRGQVGSGERNEKIRTYNFVHHHVVDTRSSRTFKLEDVLAGNLDPLIDALGD